MPKRSSLRRISELIFRASFVSSIVVCVSLILFWSLISWFRWIEEAKSIEHEYMSTQKEFLKQTVTQALSVIEYQRQQGISPKQILHTLRAMGHLQDKNGHIFVVEPKGEMILGIDEHFNPQSTPATREEVERRINAQIKTALHENPQGTYVEYLWFKQGGTILIPKVSYVTLYEPWSWIVGSGLHLDDLKAHIEQKRQERIATLQKELLQFILLLTLLVLFTMLFSRFLQKKSDRELSLLLHEVQELATQHKEIDLSKIDFVELRELAKLINQMMTLELEARAHEERLNAELRHYFSIVNRYVITSSTDLEGKITHVSEALCRLSGYTLEELKGGTHDILYHPHAPKEPLESLWEAIRRDEPWHDALLNRSKGGEPYWVDLRVEPLHDSSGKKVGYFSIAEDITDKKRIEELSITDEMSKLYNRRHFNHLLNQERENAAKNLQPIHLAILDIDFFKQFNDHYGHQAGDGAIIEVANVLKSVLPSQGAYAFRMGGEEFAVLLLGCDSKEAFEIIERVRQKLESLQIPHAKNQASPYLTISFGLFSCSVACCSTDSMYKRADQALYKAKESGRNRGEIAPNEHS